jgi:hypothetical protein
MQFDDRQIQVRGATYTPYVAEDGRVGYMVVNELGQHKLLYLNPSDPDSTDDQNVFVYVGEEDDPTYDIPLCFVNVTFE